MKHGSTFTQFLMWLTASWLLASHSQAQAKSVADATWVISTGIMALTNSSQQGGSGPSGSTILTQTELDYRFKKWLAVGAFLQFDKQGASETDFFVGPKIDLMFKVFYFEFGYAPLVNRGFTDRTIAKQTGTAMVFGGGVRVPLKGSAFLQFSYKYRIQSITEQDGTKLSDPITQTDGYPLFGIGLSLK